MAAASCGGPPSLADLKALPEAGLAPPGSVPINRNEHGAEDTIEGHVPAILGDVMATSLEAQGIFDFYDKELTDRGYVIDPKDLSNIRTTIEDEIRVWRKGDIVARVAILRVGDPRVAPLPEGLTDGAMFELAFIAKAPEDFSSPG